MRHTFQTGQWVAFPIERVFAFFANPKNLPKLMPHWQDARIDAATYVDPPPRPGSANNAGMFAAGAGSRMTLTFRLFPLSPFRMKWAALIADFQWNHHFCDEQTEGPFAYWSHCHRVATEQHDGISGTRVFDDLIYELPFGVFAELAHALFVGRQIRAIFKFRQKKLTELLEKEKSSC